MKWSKVIPAVTLAVLVTLGVAIAAEPVTYTDDFEGGANDSGWTFGGGNTTVEPTGGNPDGWLMGVYPDTFTSPKVRTTVGAPTPFHGDYAAAGVSSISVDAIHIENQYGLDISGYGMTGALYLRDNDSGMVAVTALQVPEFGNPIAVWFSVDIPLDSQAGSTPANWSDAGGGLDWPTLMAGVDEVELNWFDPDWVTIGATFTVGVDNMSITYKGGGGGNTPVDVTATGTVVFNGISDPPLGDVNGGDGVTLTFCVNSDDFDEGVPGDTRGYVIDPDSFSLSFDTPVDQGLLDPLPGTAYFTLVEGFPVSDGFFVSTSPMSPGGVPLEQTDYQLNYDLGYVGETLTSLDILDALGSYDFTGLTRFGFNIWRIAPDNVQMDIDWSGMTITEGTTCGGDGGDGGVPAVNGFGALLMVLILLGSSAFFLRRS